MLNIITTKENSKLRKKAQSDMTLGFYNGDIQEVIVSK